MVDSEDRRNFQRLLALIKDRTPLVLFVGAGISAGAGVPTASKIVKILRRLKRVRGAPSYPSAMEQAFKTAAERRAFLERTFLGKPPADEHFLLAHLAEKGVFRDILTTNFDHLTEIALAQACSSPVTVFLHKEALESIPGKAREVRVIKLHGDYLFASLANTDNETGQAVSVIMRQKLSAVLRGSGLLVAGFAGDESILEMLLEVAREPDTLAAGIWWIFHHPSRESPQMANGRAREANRIEEFLLGIRSCGKPAVLIKNANGISWLLGEICRDLAKRVPPKPAFGIGGSAYLAPYFGLPSPASPTGYAHPSPDPGYEALKRALEKPSVVLLTGATCSGKTRLVSRLISDHPDDLTFYFSFAFCRNNPEDVSFLNGLGMFVRESGLIGERDTRVFWPELIFARGGAIVLDDLPVASSLSREGAPPSTFRAALANVALPLLSVIKRLGRGNLILVRPPHLPKKLRGQLEGLVDIGLGQAPTEVRTGDDSDQPPRGRLLYRSLTDPQRRLLRHMAWLRFGESVGILSKMTRMPSGLPVLLDELVSRGIIARHAGRYVLRVPYRFGLLDHLLHSLANAKLRRDLLRIAECFRSAAEDPENADKVHYLLEAENAYFNASVGFKAAAWPRGTKMLAMAAPTFLRKSPLSHRFLFITLYEYPSHAGDLMFDGLDLRDYCTLYFAFGRLSQARTEGAASIPGLQGLADYIKENLGEAAETVRKGDYERMSAEFHLLAGLGPRDWNVLFMALRNFLERKNPVIPRWLDLDERLEQGESAAGNLVGPLVGLREELRALKRRRALTRDELWVLGRIYLGLVNARRTATGRFVAASPAALVRHARLAETCFKAAGDEIGANDAKRFAGVLHMNAGQYARGRKLLLPLLRAELGQPGFESFQAAELNNLFCTFLGSGAFRMAEGYFHEANYRYLRWRPEGYLLPLLTVGATATTRNRLAVDVQNRANVDKLFPPPLEVAEKIARICAGHPDPLAKETKENFDKGALCLAAIAAHYGERQDRDSELEVLAYLATVRAFQGAGLGG